MEFQTKVKNGRAFLYVTYLPIEVRINKNTGDYIFVGVYETTNESCLQGLVNKEANLWQQYTETFLMDAQLNVLYEGESERIAQKLFTNIDFT